MKPRTVMNGLLQRAYGLCFEAFTPLDAGGPQTLQALDARVGLAGQNPRLVADSWLRAQRLIPAGGDLR